MLLLFSKPFLLRSLVNHSPRGKVCCFPGQGMMCHLSVAIPAVFSRTLHLWIMLCSLHIPTQLTAQRPRSSKCVAKLYPGTATGEWSRSWEPRGAQLSWVVVPQMGMTSHSLALERGPSYGLLHHWCCCHHSCCWDGGRFKDGESHLNRGSFHHVQAVWKRDCGPREC